MDPPPDAGPPGDISVTDWISAVCSVVAAVVSLITVVTVYVAARQLLTEHRAYQMGLSRDTLGPWHEKVKTKHLFGLQQQINTPNVTLPALLKAAWTPKFVFPGVPCSAVGYGIEDPEKSLARASWVNFVAALGLQPRDEQFYHMSAQSDLVNGIVPMRWAGKDLVGMCTMLGFQSPEQTPSFKEPMKLPIQWSGPLGWLQFREGPNGCIVEFRRRAHIADQLSPDLHKFYDEQPLKSSSHCFMARLWRSINGMMIEGGRALYLGGVDDRAERRAKQRVVVELENNLDEFDDLLGQFEHIEDEIKRNISAAAASEVAPKAVPRPPRPPRPDPSLKKREDDTLFEDLMQTSSQEEALQRLRDPNRVKSKAQTEPDFGIGAETGPLRDLLQRMREKKLGKVEVFTSCEGLLSVVVQGELANSRGLDIRVCNEYSRAYAKHSDVDREKTPYQLGDLFMDKELLKLVKQAMGLLKPDGFYFTPNKWLASDVKEVYGHVEALCDHPDREDGIFPAFNLDEWPKSCKGRIYMHHAARLCNSFQDVRLHGHAHFTVGDMIAVSKASQSLRETPDLSWAMLISPDLFKDLGRAFKDPKGWDFLDATVTCRASVLDCTGLMKSCGLSRAKNIKYATAVSSPLADTDVMDYAVPLCPDNETFSGRDVLISFLDVLVTYFWVEKSWITNVEFYDYVIPQTITMC